MSKPSPLAIRNRVTLLWTIGITCLLLISISLGGVFNNADQALYDLLLQIRIRYQPKPVNPKIIRIDLNDSSEISLGEDLDTRKSFADLVTVLASCNTRAAMDLIFKSHADYDPAFATAISRLETLILSVTLIPEEYANFAYDTVNEAENEILRKSLWHITEHGRGSIPIARSFIMSNPLISESATALGHIWVEPDSDGIYRRTPLLYRWEDGVIPALSLAMAVDDWGINPEDIEFYPGKELVLPIEGDNPIRIPVDDGGFVIIPYTSYWADDSYRISFDQVALAIDNPELFEKLAIEISGSIALIADVTTGKRDFGVTPFEAVYPLSGIHASVLSGILNEDFYSELPRKGKVPLIITMSLLFILIGLIKKDLLYHLGFLLTCMSYTGFTIYLWYRFNILPWYWTLEIGLFSFWLIQFIFRLFYRYKEQILLQNALTRYFPQSLAERIAAEGKTELVPAYKELTIMFTDISGFTKWSADKEPDQVHTFLTDYLESMARIIHDYGGTVDKFMGDGILAFFGDPFDMPDHPERCVRAAIALQHKVTELAELWKERVQINLKVRMGINTGRVIVGNLGTQTRIEYTVIGSSVNIAQRMEASAPPGGILITYNTWERVNKAFKFGEKQMVTVKGYDDPIAGYEVDF